MDLKNLLSNPLLWAAFGGAASGGFAKVKKEATWGETAAWGAGGAVAGYTIGSLYQSWTNAKALQAQATLQAQAIKQQATKQQATAQSEATWREPGPWFAEYVEEDDTIGFAADDADTIFNQPSQHQLPTPTIVGPSSGYMGRDEAVAQDAAEQVEDDLAVGYGTLGGMATDSMDGLSDGEILESMGSFNGERVLDADAELDPYDQQIVDFVEEKERRGIN